MNFLQLRAFGHRVLRRYNRRIFRVRPGEVTGVDLEEDLRIVVGSDDPVCLDIGANEGQTIRMLQRAFQRPMIHAFEPSSAVFQKLKTQWFRCPVSFHSFAFGETITQRAFINYRKSVLSSLLPLDSNGRNYFRDTDVVGREIVDVKTVDGFITQHRLSTVDLLKIDTQGFDLAVLRGSADALTGGIVKTVLVELNFVPMYEGQASVQEITDYLASHGLFLIDYYQKERQRHALAWCSALFGRR